jgi:23S rRNA pseudouridine2457 synthase
MLLAFYKPYDVLSQFTREVETHRTLADYGFAPGVYGIGRLDRDSEGLLLLSDEAVWTDRLLNPKREHPRTYWAQVEGAMTGEAVKALREGVRMKEYRARPCGVRILDEEDPGAVLPPREPPVRYRASIPTTWVELTLTEGKNRQVRRMTAAVGHPTLRLVRVRIGGLELREIGLGPGEWRRLSVEEERKVMGE